MAPIQAGSTSNDLPVAPYGAEIRHATVAEPIDVRPAPPAVMAASAAGQPLVESRCGAVSLGRTYLFPFRLAVP
jgi:hypothetical protein